MLANEVRDLAITGCFNLAHTVRWRAAEQARRQGKPSCEDDPSSRAASRLYLIVT